MRLDRWALVALAGLACLGCGGGYGSSSSSTPTAPSGGSGGNTGSTAATITINSSNGTQAFSPNPASLAGQTVMFKNNDSVTHRVVLNDGSIDTGNIAPGGTSQAVVMPASGTNYHCAIHPGMIGAIASSAGAPPACTGSYCDPY
jgi:plastocyanin